MSRLLRRQALSIFRAALAAADPVDAVVRHLRDRGLSRFRRIFAVGAERVLGRRVAAGPVRRIELKPCGHPLPDEALLK